MVRYIDKLEDYLYLEVEETAHTEKVIFEIGDKNTKEKSYVVLTKAQTEQLVEQLEDILYKKEV